MTLVATMAHCGLLEYIKYYNNPIIRSIYKHRKERKKEYNNTITTFIQNDKYFKKKYLIECLAKKTPDYIKKREVFTICNYGGQIYSPNKGIDEFIKIARMIVEHGVSREEKIIKITGRYSINSPLFLEKSYESSADVMVKRDNDLWGEKGRGVHTYCFMAKALVLLDFGKILEIPKVRAEIGMTPVEWAFYKFIMESDYKKCIYKESLGVKATFAKI